MTVAPGEALRNPGNVPQKSPRPAGAKRLSYNPKMICFDVYLNGEKVCRAGKKDLTVMTTHVDYVDTEFDNDDPLTLSVGGLYDHPTNGRVHPRWIPRRKLEVGDEVTFQILESDTSDEPVEEYIPEPSGQEQERKYYQFLKAKYEGNTNLRNVAYPEQIPQLLNVATVWLDEAAELAARLDDERRSHILKHLGSALESMLLAKSIIGVEHEVVEETPEPDGPMSPEQKSRVDQLTLEEIQAIDEALLSNASHQFRKVARVVGTTMMKSPPHHQGIPDRFYAQRIQHLVATGQLESQGDLNYMRFSEIRLAD